MPGTGWGVFLSNSGAEAIEAAVKLARVATGRPTIIAFRGGFHGRTHGAMALTSSGVKYRGHFEPLMGGVHFAPYPYALRNPTGRDAEAAVAFSLAGIEELFATVIYPDDVAAFLVEPILGEGGYVVPPDSFLPALREVADRHGILLIADEVQTGFARTGDMFASEHEGIVPDLITTAKGIAGGLPLAGVTGRAEIMDKVHPGGLGGTFGGNPLACEAALAAIEEIESEKLTERARRIGDIMLPRLRALAERHPAIGDVRGRGAMIAIELVKEDGSPDSGLTAEVARRCHAAGLLVLTAGTYGNVLRFLPPLVIGDDLLSEGLDILAGALEANA
jgi:4-aminobutyrate aminotransferase/(S)-3-amino-2-methylpropionate transaminase